jgi:hypothetical protein
MRSGCLRREFHTVMNSHYIGPNPADEPDEPDDLPWSSMLSADEIAQVLQALGVGLGRPFTAGDAHTAVRWAEGARTSEMCLDLVLRGEVALRIDERGQVDPIAAPHVGVV